MYMFVKYLELKEQVKEMNTSTQPVITTKHAQNIHRKLLLTI